MKTKERLTEAHIEQFRCHLYNNKLMTIELANSPEFADVKTAVMSFCSKQGHLISPSIRKVMTRLNIIDIPGSYTIRYNAKTGHKTIIAK